MGRKAREQPLSFLEVGRELDLKSGDKAHRVRILEILGLRELCLIYLYISI